ncbi:MULTISPECIES: YesL family protein [Bacillus]|uniref:YesL family protein n=1 Tax=Bacillus TaxID=1386 RepID=UPI0003F6878C|nr:MULTISPECIES: YesL family protein [Bacillus]QHZ48113.1 YesL family protein [Bacillus sp. NSP9.1]WFA04191.1 YesL family protein [Bacillus sp. HSf4]
MEQDVSMGRVLSFCEWVMRFSYANLLWFAFTLFGFGVFGFMPATAALFAVTRKWVMGRSDIPIFRTFWQAYRGEFFRANAIGFILLIVGAIIYVDLAFIHPENLFLHILRFVIMVFGFLYVIMLFYVFPLLAHFDWKKRLYLKFSLLLGISYLQYTLTMIALTALLFAVFAYLPGIVPFFSVSLLGYSIMWLAYQVLKKAEATGPAERSHSAEA